MAGLGNVPKGAKEKSLDGSPSSYKLTFSAEYSIKGDLVAQNRIYILPGSTQTVTGGAATDWIYLTAIASTSQKINIDAAGGTDWLSFQQFSYNRVNYSYSGDGIRINLGGAELDGVTPGSWSASSANGSVINVENVWGSDGNDVIVGSETANELHGGQGNDRIFGVAGNNLLYGEEGNDVIVGGRGNGSFYGGTGNDYIQSARGNDWIDGGDPGAGSQPATSTFQDPSTANTNLSGGGLSMLNYGDSVDYSYLPEGWRVTLTLNGDNWVEATIYDDKGRVRERDKIKSIENIVGGLGNDPLVGDNNGNVLDGGGGDDSIQGGGGNDLIVGTGGGNDDINGGAGEDEITFVPVIDPITNNYKYSPANNKLNDDKSLVLDLRLDGFKGRYSFNTQETSANAVGPATFSVMSTTREVDDPWRGAMESIENVTGTEKNDQIAGTTGVNVLNGYDGDDLIYGAGGNDTLIGGQGNDWVLFRDATVGNQPKNDLTNVTNTDAVVIKYRDTASEFDAETDAERNPYAGGGVVRLDRETFSFSGSSGQASSFENVLGSTGDDLIVGNSVANILVGEGGKDVIYGGGGNDRLFGGATGGAGADTRYMNSLWGGDGQDVFFVGFNYNPVVGTAKLVLIDTEIKSNAYGALPTDEDPDYGIIQLGTGDFHDLIEDWQRGDKLYVAAGWTAVIQGLGSSNGSAYTERFEQGDNSHTAYSWSGNDQVDLRTTVFNDGLIRVAAGGGNNLIWGSQGSDEFRVGYKWQVSDNALSAVTTGVSGASDIIWEWDDQGATRDTLYVADGSTAIIGSLLGKSGASGTTAVGDWTGNDLIDLRSQVTNKGTIVLAAGAGINTLYLTNGQSTSPAVSQVVDASTSGSKHQIYVGYVNAADHSEATSVGVAAATDTIYGWNAQAWSVSTSYNSTYKRVGTVDTGDLVYDQLTVAAGSTAIIRSLAGMPTGGIDTDVSRWTGDQNVDLRANVYNNGTIIVSTGADNDVVYGSNGVDHIYGGSGNNFMTGWGGNDHFFVGYDYVFQTGVAQKASASAEDRILDWQSTDFLTLAKGSTAVISSLYGMDPYSGTRWNQGDTVDLRSVDGTANKGNNDNQAGDVGKIVVLTGAGDDTIYGSNGNDWVYAEGGRNLISLGSVADNDGADRVFITEWSGQYEVRGFDSDDSIYISKQMLDAFFTATVEGYTATAGDGYDVFGDDYSAGSYFLDATSGQRTAGAAYGESSLFPTSKLVWDAAYKDALGDYYTANGAWSNYAHYAAEVGGTAAVSALAYGYLALAGGLVAIPFVGPFLAIPVYVIAGLTIADAVLNTDPHNNATYTVSDGFGDYVTEFGYGQFVGSSDSAWNDIGLLSFFNIPTDRFTPTLEILSTDYTTGELNIPTYKPYGAEWDLRDGEYVPTQGIANLVTIYNGTETFIYLVYSNDWMIQSNEVRLIAQVNGHVTANQLVIYDTITDPYMAGKTPTAPVSAPKLSTIAIVKDVSGIDPVAGKLLTSDSTPTVAIELSKALTDTDELVIQFKGVTLTTGIIIAPDKINITVTLPEQTIDGVYVLNVTVNNADGFSSSADVSIGIDAKPIPAGDITVQSTSAGLNFGFVQDDASTTGVDETAPAENATVKLTLSGGPTLTSVLNADNGFGNSLELAAQGSAVLTGTLSVTDALGRVTQLSGYSVTLGTDDTVTTDTITGETGKINFLYGFGGNDTLTASSTGDYLYGGDGNDVLNGGSGKDYLDGGAGDDTLSGGNGDDVLVGGRGADAMTGGAGKDAFTWNSTLEFDEGDTISDFVKGTDKLQFSASALGSEFIKVVDVLDSSGHNIIQDFGADKKAGGGDDVYLTQEVVVQLESTQFKAGPLDIGDTGVRFFYEVAGGNLDLYFDADGFGGKDAQLVVTLTGVTELALEDILLV